MVAQVSPLAAMVGLAVVLEQKTSQTQQAQPTKDLGAANPQPATSEAAAVEVLTP